MSLFLFIIQTALLSWRTAFIRTPLVVIALGLLAVCYGCCVPKSFSGPVRVLRSTVAPGMPNTSVEVFMNAYDAENKRLAIGYREARNNQYTRYILDYGKGLQFIVEGGWYGPSTDTKCTKYPLNSAWRDACVPANATESERFYLGHQEQQYYRQLDAMAFTYSQGSIKAKAMVTQDSCALVGEVVYDISDSAGAKVISRLYVNQSLSVYSYLFDLPANVTCVLNLNPPVLSLWQRLGLFGWLLGLADMQIQNDASVKCL